ncbi:2-oxoglutarate and iron-dependent oxygenase domain-containing protein 1 [Elysia marginata]|uniref:2-oxoglutarate and iron-dependent oxygenase domain-containing protein 1 n=1 Tax=Elysia marginata TaxID=1093978 RepID=A0AAV4FQF4_9GAST|nr:2-oxoglutarate and iron-dependent oxygenase domain-containing protein 1 [Elysia marginata]
MYKKKACIESLASQENQASPSKSAKLDTDVPNSPTTFVASDATDGEDTLPGFSTSSHGPEDIQTTPSSLLPGATGAADQQKRIACLNESILKPSLETELQKNFAASTDYFDDASGVKLCHVPFRHCILPNFITSQDYLNDLESALLDLPLRDKNNDLYKFSQSRDLNHSKSSTISSFRAMCELFREFLATVTGIPLNSKIDFFCSQYKYTDVLLCHDDELEERRIAFIYYLVPELWSQTDGGTLDLFDSDNLGQPKSIVKSVVPKRNSFLFFEVSALSFHQVAEVLAEEKTRLSISGWFHGPPLSRPEPFFDTLPPAVPYGSIEEDVFYAWFNPLYLAPDVQTDVRKRFEEDSEIELTDFLQEEKYNALMAALKEENINWNLVGPANKRNYYVAEQAKLPPIVAEFLRIIQSDAAFLVLSNLTGLRLHPLAPADEDGENDTGSSSVSNGGGNPRCRSEVRKWEHGCYTLAHDTDTEIQDFALDAMMYVGCENGK